MHKKKTTTALILENLQIDYFEGGAMEVAESNSILQSINQQLLLFKNIVVALEWHPADHISFAANHPWRKIGQVIKKEDYSVELQPIHCVQNTFGAALHPLLKLPETTHTIYKGISKQFAAHSALYDMGKERKTGLLDYLRNQSIQHVYIAGMVLEKNILMTAQDALQLGFQVSIIQNICKGHLIDNELDDIWQRLRSLGVHIENENNSNLLC